MINNLTQSTGGELECNNTMINALNQSTEAEVEGDT
jgi:hypothetical protein